MMNCKKLSLGLVAATMLATPAMAQVVYQQPGVTGFNYPNSAYAHEATVLGPRPDRATITVTGFIRPHASVHLRQRHGTVVPTPPMASASLSASGDAL